MVHALRIIALSIILQRNTIIIGFRRNDNANREFDSI